MKFLFVHQNFPGQYVHLARYLAGIAGNEVVFLTQRQVGAIPGVRKIVYAPARKAARNLTTICAGRAGRSECSGRGSRGDRTQEIWYLKDVFPNAPLLGYFEFYYQASGADVGFDPAAPARFDDWPRLRTKNIGNLMGLEACDLVLCPTQWQRSVFPQKHQSMLRVIHDGITRHWSSLLLRHASSWRKTPLS